MTFIIFEFVTPAFAASAYSASFSKTSKPGPSLDSLLRGCLRVTIVCLTRNQFGLFIRRLNYSWWYLGFLLRGVSIHLRYYKRGIKLIG